MLTPMVFIRTLVILHGILAVSGISQMYNLMGKDYGTMPDLLSTNHGIMHKFTCGIKCMTDWACKGFIHTFEGECVFIEKTFFTVMTRRLMWPGAKMYWKVGGMIRYWRHEDRFFMYSKTNIPAHLADVTCEFFKGTTVIPKNSEENKLIASLQTKTVWLGIRRKNGIFVNQYTGAPLDYTNWESGKPANGHSNKDCAIVDINGLWHEKACSSKTQAMCQMYVRDCWEGYEDQRCFIFT